MMARVVLSIFDQALVLEGFSTKRPPLESKDKLMMLLRYLVQSYSKNDGPSLSSLDVPVELINHVVRVCNVSIEQV